MNGPERITISINAGGELNIYMNESGRDRLVRELQGLSKRWDHIHLDTFGGEIELREIPYHPIDKIVHIAKFSLRPDEWDQEYFPHVLEDPPST